MNQLFPDITDNFALNFLNSRINKNNKTIELLDSKTSLINWLQTSSFKVASYKHYQKAFLSLAETIDSISVLQQVRNDLYDLVVACIDNEKNIAKLKQTIDDHLKQSPITVSFDKDDKLYYKPINSGIEGIYTLLLLSLASLIDSHNIYKLSRCHNHDCLLIFINKNGQRKWCSMKICGNRNKVKTFEAKVKG